MKQIRIWKLAILIAITFGIYAFYWFLRTRSVLNLKHKQHIPHWLWLILPPALATLLMIPAMIMLISAGVVGIMAPGTLAIATYVVIAALMVISFAITLWWMWKFGKAIEVVTKGRVPAGLTLVLYIFIGPFVALPHQYYLNRIETQGPKQAKASSKLLTYASVAVGASLGMTIISFSSLPSDIKEMERTITESVTEVNKAEVYNKRVEEYNQKYKTCMDDLNRKYPGDLSIEDEPSYKVGYGVCDQIWLEEDKFIKDSQ